MITTLDPPIERPAFGRLRLQSLLAGNQEGYDWTRGIHVYSELRPVEGLEIAESEHAARLFLQIIEDYTHAGVLASRLFGMELLEVQGTVLHFHLEGNLDSDKFKAALKFCYIFTKVLYETLAKDLDGRWNGFAICMDHGPAIVVRHGQTSNSSAVSLGEAANAPAKRLLYGRTAAGHAEYPGAWMNKPQTWEAINLRDRTKVPYIDEFENTSIEAEFRHILNEYREQRKRSPYTGSIPIWGSAQLVDQGGYTADHPLRVQAFCMRVDLDGFSPQVKAAFNQGQEAVEAVAVGFLQIMQFGDHFQRQHLASIRLPWAGDCATFLFPSNGDLHSFRGKNWIEIVEQWQKFSSQTADGKQKQWNKVFDNVAWSVGMTYAEQGNCLVAPIQAANRNFLVAAGAPVAFASNAQNLGKGNETVIHNSDHQALFPPVRKLFDKLAGTDFWRGNKITMDKVAQAIVEAGRSKNVESFTAKAASITYPPVRPYCR